MDYRPAFKINPYFKNEYKRKIPKLLTAFCLFLLYAFGLDFGFTNVFNKSVRQAFKLLGYLSIALNLGVIAYITFEVMSSNAYKGKDDYVVYNSITYMQYILDVFCLQLTKYNFDRFLEDVYVIDPKVAPKENRVIGFSVIMSTVILIFKVFGCIARCNSVILGLCTPVFMQGCVISQALEMIPVIRIFVFYYIYHMIRPLLDMTERKSEDLDLDTKWKQYSAIADCCDKINPLYGRLTIIELMGNLPKLLMSTFVILKLVRDGDVLQENENIWVHYINLAVIPVHMLAMICIAASMVQLVENQVGALKESLVNVDDTDSHTKARNLLKYIEARSLQQKALAIIPTDSRMLTALFSLGSTYFIVVIQLTHLYD